MITDGEYAYEAWAEHSRDPRPWDELPEQIRQAWELIGGDRWSGLPIVGGTRSGKASQAAHDAARATQDGEAVFVVDERGTLSPWFSSQTPPDAREGAQATPPAGAYPSARAGGLPLPESRDEWRIWR